MEKPNYRFAGIEPIEGAREIVSVLNLRKSSERIDDKTFAGFFSGCSCDNNRECDNYKCDCNTECKCNAQCRHCRCVDDCKCDTESCICDDNSCDRHVPGCFDHCETNCSCDGNTGCPYN